MSNFKERIWDWGKDNPLRKFLSSKPNGKGVDGLHGLVRECAIEMGVSRQTVSNWLHGIYLPRMEHFKLLASKYGVDSDDWFDWWNARPTRTRKGSKAS